MKIAVVGAGILGINTAYYLAKKGHDVVVFESKEQPGMDTSYSNGGQISASSAEMWTKWDNIKKVLDGCSNRMHLYYLTPHQIFLI